MTTKPITATEMILASQYEGRLGIEGRKQRWSRR
jgi:hypothetical protein